MTPRLPLRSLSAPRGEAVALAAVLALLVALDLARPYAGPGLRPWQFAAGALAVAILAVVLRSGDGGRRPRWPVLALAALRTSSAAATLLGLDKSIGTLEAGKEADVIAVAGDALADIKATEKVVFVMRGGTVHRNDAAAASPKP